MKRSKVQADGGMTLMEIIIAIVFMSIVVLGLLSVTGYAFDILGVSRVHMEENYNVQKLFEESLVNDGSATGTAITLDINWESGAAASDFESPGLILQTDSSEAYLEESFNAFLPAYKYR